MDSKAAGITSLRIAQVLTEYDYSLLDKRINWVKPVSSEEIKEYFKGVTLGILYGQEQVQHNTEQDIEHKGRHR